MKFSNLLLLYSISMVNAYSSFNETPEPDCYFDSNGDNEYSEMMKSMGCKSYKEEEEKYNTFIIVVIVICVVVFILSFIACFIKRCKDKARKSLENSRRISINNNYSNSNNYSNNNNNNRNINSSNNYYNDYNINNNIITRGSSDGELPEYTAIEINTSNNIDNESNHLPTYEEVLTTNN